MADTMDGIEQRFEDEHELRRLLAAAEDDERLTLDERRVAVDRCAFYLGDFHARRRELDRLECGEFDVLPLER